MTRCATCGGSGYVRTVIPIPFFPFSMPAAEGCLTCGGSGRLFDWDEIEAEKDELLRKGS